MTQELCFWSIGDGDYACMLEMLVASFHRTGMRGDFYAFSDRPIAGAETIITSAFDKRGYLFKIAFLKSMVSKMDYRYFVYLDADTLFVRKPERSLLDLLQGDSLHFFCENDCTLPSIRQDWWNCPLKDYVQLMRDCGVTQPAVYNLNSGMFIIRKDIIEIACDLAMDFWQYALRAGHFFPDEPAWAYAMHMLCEHPEKHLLNQNWDIWCSDWEGQWSQHLPDGKEWTFRNYFNYEPHQINPAIVHAVKSKDLLVATAKHSSGGC